MAVLLNVTSCSVVQNYRSSEVNNCFQRLYIKKAKVSLYGYYIFNFPTKYTYTIEHLYYLLIISHMFQRSLYMWI
jgi:hypothetical protein